MDYADVLGIPFDSTAKPVVAPPQPPRETVQVKAVKRQRDHLQIRFPRVDGYRVELPNERLTARVTEDSILELTPERGSAPHIPGWRASSAKLWTSTLSIVAMCASRRCSSS